MSEIMLLGHKMEHNCIKPFKWLKNLLALVEVH